MKNFAWLALCALPLVAADAPAPSMGKILDGQLKMVENEFVPLAEAMPADKYSFAPTSGEFKNVRTFGQQVSHVATVLYMVSAALLGEKSPKEPGTNANGPASLRAKDDIVKYLKDAFAYSHKAMATVTDQNATEMIQSAFGSNKTPRAGMANVNIWHPFDHYGQMVVYARMNGVVPPASR
jgi:hypothetical protein